jgi:hypothetical protein
MQRKYKIYHFQNPQSTYDMHILNNKHEHGSMNITMSLLYPVHKIQRMNLLKNIYIQFFQRHNTNINEQSQKGEYPLVDLISDITLKHACAWPAFFLPDWSSVRPL